MAFAPGSGGVLPTQFFRCLVSSCLDCDLPASRLPTSAMDVHKFTDVHIVLAVNMISSSTRSASRRSEAVAWARSTPNAPFLSLRHALEQSFLAQLQVLEAVGLLGVPVRTGDPVVDNAVRREPVLLALAVCGFMGQAAGREPVAEGAVAAHPRRATGPHRRSPPGLGAELSLTEGVTNAWCH